MIVHRKQKKFVKILSSKVFLFLLILACAGIVKLTIEKYTEVSKATATLREQEQKIKEGEKKNKELKNTLKYLKTKEYLESVAKKKLNLVKPGEKVIYVMPEEEKEKEEVKKSEEKKKNFWEKIKEIFKKEDK